MIVFMTIGSLLNARFAPVFGADRILRHAVIVPAVVGPAAIMMGWIEARHGTIGMWPFLLLRAADRHRQPDRPDLDGAGRSPHVGDGLVADGG